MNTPKTLLKKALSHLNFTSEIFETRLSIYDLFKRSYSTTDNVVFLESLGEYEAFSRYSMLLLDPTLTIKAKGNTLWMNENKFTVENPFNELKIFEQYTQDIPGFRGGLFGYMSYEATKYLDKVDTFYENTDFYDFEFGLFLDGFVFDKSLGTLEYFTYGENRLQSLQKLFQNEEVFEPFTYEEISKSISRDDYVKSFEKAKNHIEKGDVFQIILSVGTQYEISGTPWLVYDSLRKINPSPYLSYVKFDDRELITSSVDLVMRVERTAHGKREIKNFPLAGTTLRGKDQKEDHILFDQLKEDEKERAEHMMLVDMGRNDLGRVCEFGSIGVEKLMIPKRFRHVQHIESQIKGTLLDNASLFDAMAATAPMGTVSGAPKIEAMKIIYSLEHTARGPYAGQIGGFCLTGNAFFSVGLRSLFISGKHGYTQAGSGIVDDSSPEYEYREILRKSDSILTAMNQARILGTTCSCRFK